MRDIETIDAGLRGAWLATLNGCSPSTMDIENELLDERAAALSP
ncbi:MAG: hypothetical protein ACLPLP_07910 [Mycobacterium sp.]